MAIQATPSQNQVPNEPQLDDLLNLHRKEIFLSLNCHHVGTIESFNPALQTASVSINYLRTYYERDASGNYSPVTVAYPLMIDAPVIVLGGSGGALTFPIEKGDECLVLFNDRDIDNWFSGSSNSALASSRAHSFSDGLVLVGLRSLANVLLGYDAERVALRNGLGAKVSIGTDHVEAQVGLTPEAGTTLRLEAGKFGVTNPGGIAEYTATISELIEKLTALLTDIQSATTATMLGPQPLVMPTFAVDLAALNTTKAKFDTFKP